jgi:hypothetical protein
MSDEYNPSPIGNPSPLKRRSWLETQVVKFIGRHTPKCREVVRILSQSMDGPLPLSMRIKLQFHYLICAWCQRYAKQLHIIRKLMRALPEKGDECCPPGDEQLPATAKERMKKAINDAKP